MENNSFNEWKYESLGNYIKVRGGKAFKSKEFKEQGVPILRISNIKNNRIDLKNCVYTDPDELKDYSSHLLENGNIVIAMSGATTGKTGTIQEKNLPLLLNQRVGVFEIQDNTIINQRFLKYVIESTYFQNILEIDAIGGAQPNISPSQIESIHIFIPPSNEQQKIASILSSVDKAIEKTEQILDQTNIVKKGLIYQIFTKGIDSTNSRKTKVGEVPAYWRLHSLSDIADVIDPQPDHRAPKEDQNGLPYVGVGDVNIDGTLNFKKARKITVEAVTKQENSFTIEKGDIAFGKVGTLGKPRFLPTDVRYALSATMVLIKPQDIDYKFLYYALQSPILAQQIHMQTTGGTRPTIGILKLRQFVIPIPTREEQYRVATSLDNVEDKIKIERKKLSFLKNIKKGLMQQLLTGKVRVPMSENEEVRQ